ncbi:MAG TPA: DUF5683 domain-containing protein [Bacteroidota bacterium]|nr:DUF5683 domain-containing protein [Bacteroidota bacterium]
MLFILLLSSPIALAVQARIPVADSDSTRAQAQGREGVQADSVRRVTRTPGTTVATRVDSVPAVRPVIRWNEDSLIAVRMAATDTVMRPKKSATIAMLASLVLPGAGQIYNESYWKAPVIWGFGAYFYSAYRIQDKKYKQYRDAYAATVRPDTLNGQGVTGLQTSRNFYYDDRNKFGWYIAITYVVTLVDAYVDASLFNFEVSPDLQPHGEWKATLHIRLP